jgi:hypothetical protein
LIKEPNVLPRPARNAMGTCGLLKKFAKKAPKNTPGRATLPNKRRDASAIPSGGQTGETWLFKNEN